MQIVNQKSRNIYQLLALFLGGLGIHNFYAGYIGRGIVQLLLCVTGISEIWAFIEIFVVDKDADNVPMIPPKLYVFGYVFGAIAAIILFFFGIVCIVHYCDESRKNDIVKGAMETETWSQGVSKTINGK